MDPIDYDNAELKRIVRLCEPDLRGWTRNAAKQLRAETVSPAKLLHVRTLLGLTKKETADFVGVSALTYASWEQGRTVPTSRFMPALVWLKLQVKAAQQGTALTPDERLYNELNRYHPQPPGLLPRPYLPRPATVRAVRKALGMTLGGFAEACGVSTFSTRTWETGETEPAPHATRTMLALLADKIKNAHHENNA